MAPRNNAAAPHNITTELLLLTKEQEKVQRKLNEQTKQLMMNAGLRTVNELPTNNNLLKQLNELMNENKQKKTPTNNNLRKLEEEMKRNQNKGKRRNRKS